MNETASGSPDLSVRRRWAVLAVCASALFLVGLDTTIVTVGLPAIGSGLDVDSDRLAWVVDSYAITFASLLITSGALADRFGRRRVFRIGLVLFALASLACALAPSLSVLIAGRALQGVGASMLTPVALAIVVNAMPDPRERAAAIGVWSSVFGLSMAAGPVTGGALIALFGWRAVFWINVSVVAVALVLVALLVPESTAGRARRLDLAGQVLLVGILGLGIGLLIEAPRLGWGTAWPMVGIVVLTALVIAFVIVEMRRNDPLIEPGLFRSSRFSGAVLAAIAVFISFSMTLLMSTVVLQEVLDWSPLAAGAATLPMAVGATVCAPASGILVGRAGPRIPLMVAGVGIALGGALFLAASSTAEVRIPILLAAYLIIGIGVGFANAPITNTAVSGLPPERSGVAGGITSTARQLGTAIGIALAGGLVAAGSADGPVIGAGAGWLIVIACGITIALIAVGAQKSTMSATALPVEPVQEVSR